ncbi:MAG: oxidoreductase [Chromatiales bacterium]|nr:oxidoreductase [Gammaproteobacteria bacterium]MCP5352658.1 oxidoreductase [Chromatiales bacterium]
MLPDIWLPIAPIALPLALALVSLVWPRRGFVLAVGGAGLLLAIALAALVATHDGTLAQNLAPTLGGWPTVLGVGLRLDLLSALFLSLTAGVGLAVVVYAQSYFRAAQARAFWPMWWLLVTALNTLFLAADLFNVYVALELLGLAAVGLSALAGSREALAAALRYLLVGLLGSLLYLLAVALLYLQYGALDIATIAARIEADAPLVGLALVLASAGLIYKAALYPLHFWLPGAHASAAAPVSAALSALVIKAAWYLLMRLWLELFPAASSAPLLPGLALLGAAGVLYGSWRALRAPRLKLLAAWSSVAQLGYLFLGLAMLLALPPGPAFDTLFGGLLLFALGHGLAKAGLFLAAGSLLHRLGHDRIDAFDGLAHRLPATAFAISIAGVALIGLPPSGAFLGKWLMLETAFAAGDVWIVLVIGVGTLLAGAYVFRVIGQLFSATAADATDVGPVAPPALHKFHVAGEEVPALLLGLAATLLLGLGAAPLWDWLS